jgi:hypothetical protein
MVSGGSGDRYRNIFGPRVYELIDTEISIPATIVRIRTTTCLMRFVILAFAISL